MALNRGFKSLSVGDSNHYQFSFRNLPPGEYAIKFAGTVNGSATTLLWTGLKIDTDGGRPQWNLDVRDAEKEEEDE